MVALSPSPNDTVSATTLANCRPSPIAHSTVPAITTGKMPGRMLTSITTSERNAKPMKAATKTISTVKRPVELADHVGAVARGDRRQAGDRDLVARMRLAHLVERLVELVDHRQQLARVDVGNAARHHDGILVGRDEAAHQMLRQDVDILLQRRDIAVPAFSASQRRSVSSDQTLPTPACGLDDRVDLGDASRASPARRGARPSGIRSARRSDWRR